MSLWAKITLLVAVEIAALTVMIVDKQWTLITGTPIVLQTEPIDPRSLLMGDYVRLNYAISHLRLDGENAIAGDKNFRSHDVVWVVLKPDPDGAKAVAVHHQRETIAPGLVVLKGEVIRFDESEWDADSKRSSPREILQVRYGIEQYFVQEGTGRAIERPLASEKLTILVAVDTRGKAGIQALLFNGRERYRETLF